MTGAERFRPFVLALGAALLVTGLYAVDRLGTAHVPLLSGLEQDLLDWRFHLRGEVSSGPEVVVLAVDDETTEKAPELLERRAGWAKVVRTLAEMGAEVIVLDVFFARPEELLPPRLVARIEEALAEGELSPEGRRLLLQVAQLSRGDDELAQAIGAAENVVLAVHLGAAGTVLTDPGVLDKAAYGEVVSGPHSPPGGDRVMTSLPMFHEAARLSGLATTYEDPFTARVWELPLARRTAGRTLAPLAVMAVSAYEGHPRGALAWVGTDGTARVGPRTVPSARADMLINYRGGTETFPTFSVYELISGQVEPEAVAGKIVIVGITELIHDRVATPFGARVPGVEAHASAIDSILRGDVLERTRPLSDVGLSLLFALLTAALFLPLRTSPWVRVGGLALLAGAVLGGGGLAFVRWHLWVPAMAPILVVGTGGVAGMAAAYFDEGLRRRRLKATFARYLSDDLLTELVKDPSRASLQGERRELSVLFTDIRSFTTFAETMEPLALAAFLNRFFSPMSAAVLDHGGYLDKYIGDAIMAVFGAPLPRASHALDACQAALTMHRALQSLRREAAVDGIELDMGVGINTGDVVVGNLGSEQRFDYTVVGDAVNIASRLEGLTKRYGVFCIVGEQTRAEAKERFSFRSLDLVRVKGKQRPAEIFELCVAPRAGLAVWDQAQAAWREGRLTEAKERFAAFLEESPGDPVARLFLERIAALGEQAPSGWDGVFIHDEK